MIGVCVCVCVRACAFAIVMRQTQISLVVIYTSDTSIDSSDAEGRFW